MEQLDVSTVVAVPPAEAYEFLVDFPGYARYTEYLEEVRQHGDGGPGTRYDLVLSWWRLSYTARSRVTDTERPRRVDWRLEDALEARGCWLIEPLSAAAADEAISAARAGPEDADAATLEADGEDEDVPTATPNGGRETTVADHDSGDARTDVDPEDATACRIRLRASFDSDSLGDANLGIPLGIPTGAVLDRLGPVAKREAKRIIGRIVADLEGAPRPVTLEVADRPDFL